MASAGTYSDSQSTCLGMTGISDPIPAGKTFTAVVKMFNTGSYGWGGGESPHKLRLWDPQESDLYGVSEVFLPAPYAVPRYTDSLWTSNSEEEAQEKSTVSFVIQATAPLAPGTYPFSWRMYEQPTSIWYLRFSDPGIGWFGSVCDGSITVSKALPPVATTQPASSLTLTSAVLNGIVNPNGITPATTAFNVFSTNDSKLVPKSCSDTSPWVSKTTLEVSGSEDVAYTHTLSGLSPGTTYYFCAVARNASGTGYGNIQSFQTPSAGSCTLGDGTIVQNHASINAFTNRIGNPCWVLGDQRTCNNGVLSGYDQYAYSSCTEYNSSCTFDGVTLRSGDTITAYESNLVRSLDECRSEERQCSHGRMEGGSYTYSSCRAFRDCTLSGITVKHGEKITTYVSHLVYAPDTCSSEQRTCNDGTLSGWYTSTVCRVKTLPTLTFTASPAVVPSGVGTVELKWSTTNVSGPCMASGSWSGSKTGSGGSEIIPFSSFHTAGIYSYNLQCWDSEGYPTLPQPTTATATVVYSCTGTIPTNASLCSGDDAGLLGNISRSAVSSCTTATKCEYTCASGYMPSGGSCVPVSPTITNLKICRDSCMSGFLYSKLPDIGLGGFNLALGHPAVTLCACSGAGNCKSDTNGAPNTPVLSNWTITPATAGHSNAGKLSATVGKCTEVTAVSIGSDTITTTPILP